MDSPRLDHSSNTPSPPAGLCEMQSEVAGLKAKACGQCFLTERNIAKVDLGI